MEISSKVKNELKRLSQSRKEESRIVERAKIILEYLSGSSYNKIAKKLGISRHTAQRWCKRFVECPSLSSLYDFHRSGTPSTIAPDIKAILIALACTRPKDVEDCKTEEEVFEKTLSGDDKENSNSSRSGAELLWTLDELTLKVEDLTGIKISKSYAGKLLNNADIRPHKKKMWLHSSDPEFAEKTKRICDIYLDKEREETVICVDEKTGMQAIERKYETMPAMPGLPVKEEYEYIRNGTQTLIAGFDISTGEVFASCGKTRKADDLMSFMHELAGQIEGKIIIIWDNLNIHKGTRWEEFNEAHGDRFSFVYTPIHASWLNQIEIWFGILHRKILRGSSFLSEDDLREKVLAFIEEWNTDNKKAFKWKFNGIFN